MSKSIQIVGAGFSGAVVARQLAEAGHSIEVVESRSHVAGNCHTQRDSDTGVMVHIYGPHIFHTADREVWEFVQRFGVFVPYRHRVQTTVNDRVFSLPINLLTINQFFSETFGPCQAQEFIESIAQNFPEAPKNFEEQALSMVGAELYEAFFKGYTQKQWGCEPKQLPASILKRLPLRFNYDDSYFSHPFQGIPKNGYTAIVSAILDHPLIRVTLNKPFDSSENDADHLFWTGPLDAYFKHDIGRLGYRTLKFDHNRSEGDHQGTPVMNYGDPDCPYTRITEHKHFAPWEDHSKTIWTKETSHACGPTDTPYYPIRLTDEKSLLRDYCSKANATKNVTFLGRLGTYRYLDMDVAIKEALEVSQSFLNGKDMPAFVHAPL